MQQKQQQQKISIRTKLRHQISNLSNQTSQNNQQTALLDQCISPTYFRGTNQFFTHKKKSDFNILTPWNEVGSKEIPKMPTITFNDKIKKNDFRFTKPKKRSIKRINQHPQNVTLNFNTIQFATKSIEKTQKNCLSAQSRMKQSSDNEQINKKFSFSKANNKNALNSFVESPTQRNPKMKFFERKVKLKELVNLSMRRRSELLKRQINDLSATFFSPVMNQFEREKRNSRIREKDLLKIQCNGRMIIAKKKKKNSYEDQQYEF